MRRMERMRRIGSVSRTFPAAEADDHMEDGLRRLKGET